MCTRLDGLSSCPPFSKCIKVCQSECNVQLSRGNTQPFKLMLHTGQAQKALKIDEALRVTKLDGFAARLVSWCPR